MSDIHNLQLNAIAINSHDTYQFNNSTIFYSLVNPAFLNYYNRVVRKAQQWLDGYDPSFHKLDMFSSGIAEKVVFGLANSVLGKGFVFKKGKGNNDVKNTALNFIAKDWAIKSKFEQNVKLLIAYTLALGTGCLKVNKGLDKKLWIEAQRLDYFYFSVNGRKEIIEYTGFVRAIQSTKHENENYFLVEKRYFKKVDKEFRERINGVDYKFVEGQELVPVVEYSVHLYRGQVQNNQMADQRQSVGIPYKSLPTEVKDVLKREYGFIKCDEPQPLPFKDWLGVELFFNEGGDITNPTLPFGKSQVFSNLTNFMEYDLERSYAIRDLYNSRGIVGLPRSLSQSDLVGMVEHTAGNAQQYANVSAYGQLNIPGYEVVPGLNPENQKPIITQFEIRAQEHEAKQNAIIRAIALSIGVSPKILASYLVGGTQQTDDQIQSEDNSVIQWIKGRRKDYIDGLNNIIEKILNYSGYADNVMLSFASDDLLKEDMLLASIEKKMDLGLMDIEDAIRELYPDLDEEQLQVKIAKAKNLQEQQSQQMASLDPFGLDDEEEQFN